jgi:predicted DNA-binding protein with PD1-like motif
MVIFDPGEEAIEGLAAFARDGDVEVAEFTAIGGFEGAALGFYNRETGSFDEIPYHEDQVEVLSMTGEITKEEGEEGPHVHAHVVLGRRDGSTLGGHLLKGLISPILIVTVNELARSPHDHHSHHHPPNQQHI